MTRSSRTPSPLTVDGETFLWTVRHEHGESGDDGHQGCREVLTIRRPGALGRLTITFAPGPGHLVPDTHAPEGPEGAVGTPDGTWLDLRDADTVGALLAVARDRGLVMDSAAVHELDGWALFAAAARAPGATRGKWRAAGEGGGRGDVRGVRGVRGVRRGRPGAPPGGRSRA